MYFVKKFKSVWKSEIFGLIPKFELMKSHTFREHVKYLKIWLTI